MPRLDFRPKWTYAAIKAASKRRSASFMQELNVSLQAHLIVRIPSMHRYIKEAVLNDSLRLFSRLAKAELSARRLNGYMPRWGPTAFWVHPVMWRTMGYAEQLTYTTGNTWWAN